MGDIKGAEKDYKKAKNRGFKPYGLSDAVLLIIGLLVEGSMNWHDESSPKRT